MNIGVEQGWCDQDEKEGRGRLSLCPGSVPIDHWWSPLCTELLSVPLSFQLPNSLITRS